MAKRKRTTI